MIRFILILAVLSISMALGYLVQIFPARVNINVMHYTVTTNLIVWLLCSVIAALILIYLFRIIRFIWCFPDIFSRRVQIRRQRKSAYLLQSGLKDLYAGHFRKAEKKLVRGGEMLTPPDSSAVLFFESAAIAADKLNAPVRRDRYLMQSRENAKLRDTGLIAINEAQMQIDNNNLTAALNILEDLRLHDPKNMKILLMLDEVYAQLARWEDAWHNLKLICPFLSQDEINFRKHRYAQGMLDDTEHIKTYEQLLHTWHKLSTQMRTEKDIILQFASALVKNGYSDRAEKLLARQINKDADIDYVQAYSQLHSIHYDKALANMDSWEKSFKGSALFLYCKANLAYQAKKFSLANDYIQVSLKQAQTAESFALWAQILENCNKPDAALVAYRQSILLTDKTPTFSGELYPVTKNNASSTSKADSAQLTIDSYANTSKDAQHKLSTDVDEKPVIDN